MVEWSRVRSQRHGEPQPQEDIEEDSYRPVLWRKEWTSERMRRVMQRESMSGMGVALDISANRQITKAITQRFFQGPFGMIGVRRARTRKGLTTCGVA